MKKNDEITNVSIVVFVILGLLALFSVISLQTQWGITYMWVFVVTFLFILGYFVLPKVFEFKTIEPENIELQIIVGFALGFIFVGGLYLGLQQFSLFAFLSPLSAPPAQAGVLGALGFAVLGQIGLMSIAVSEFEETLRAGTLRPTFEEWMGGKYMPVLIFSSGLVIAFFLEPIRILGFGMMAMAGLAYITKTFEIENPWVRVAISIIVAASFFMLLHWRAYATEGVISTAMLFNAFLFAAIADTINCLFKGSTVSGKIAHTQNNAAITCYGAGVPIIFALVVTAIHAGLLYLISKTK